MENLQKYKQKSTLDINAIIFNIIKEVEVVVSVNKTFLGDMRAISPNGSFPPETITILTATKDNNTDSVSLKKVRLVWFYLQRLYHGRAEWVTAKPTCAIGNNSRQVTETLELSLVPVFPVLVSPSDEDLFHLFTITIVFSAAVRQHIY